MDLRQKKWEILEEYAHFRVKNSGWKSDEIAKVTAELSKSRSLPGGQRVRIQKPKDVAEEIVVKQFLIDNAKLGPAEVEVLNRQINHLRTFGFSRGY